MVVLFSYLLRSSITITHFKFKCELNHQGEQCYLHNQYVVQLHSLYTGVCADSKNLPIGTVANP